MLNTPIDFTHPSELEDVVDALLDARPGDALRWAEEALTAGVAHAEVYYALALLDNGYSPAMAREQLDTYEARAGRRLPVITPMYFFCLYLLWRKTGASSKKLLRLRAADALAAARYDEVL